MRLHRHKTFVLSVQVDELTKIVNQVGDRVERVKQNHGAILVSYKNQGMSNIHTPANTPLLLLGLDL